MSQLGDRLTNAESAIFNQFRDNVFIDNHPKLTPESLICKMEEKGIKFEVMNKEDAIVRLMQNTYYFKIGVYRFNYKKGSDGKYENLDFAYLDDLAIIDMRFRKLMLEMSLDLEHSLKTMLQANITKDGNEDGYSIVRDFENEKAFDSKELFKHYESKKHYLNNLKAKYQTEPPIWVILELMSFGNLAMFTEFYYDRVSLHKNKFKDAAKLIRYAKNVRNAAAHNNPLIVNLTDCPKISPNSKILAIASDMGLDGNLCRYSKINDIFCLFYLHNSICSDGVKKHKANQFEEFVERCKRHADYYKNNQLLENLFKMFNVVLEYYKPA